MGMNKQEGRVLVVDDDPQIRRVMRTTLEAKGFVIDEAGSGEQALEFARTEKYDLILLDINLPGKTGIEICREIHTSSPSPIIMLTVRDASEDKIEALDAGACDYLTKPFAMGELLARIRAVMRRTPSTGFSGVTVLKLDDVEINFESRRVIVAERKYLRVFINRLRKKIEASPREPKFLLTEPFVGYRLQSPE